MRALVLAKRSRHQSASILRCVSGTLQMAAPCCSAQWHHACMDEGYVRMLEPPIENQQCYRLLFTLETVLRSLTRESMEKVRGSRWFRTHTSAAILDRIRAGIGAERNATWTRSPLHDPTYYLDFTNYAEIIERTDNWRDVFRAIFQRKEIILAALRSIEPTRNKIAHNRTATAADVALLTASCNAVRNMIGENHWRACAGTPVRLESIAKDLRAVLREIEMAREMISNPSNILPRKALSACEGEWWFDEAILGEECND